MRILDPNQQGAEQLKGTFLEESPQDAKKTDVYLTGLSQLLYDGKTKGKVVESLKSASPEKSIPNTAIVLNEQMEKQVSSKGKPPTLATKINANLFLVSELVEMGNAAGIFVMNQEEMVGVFQATLQQYIHKGIKEKTIDPMELQDAMEGLMTPEQKQQGLQAAQEIGVPQEAGVGQAMEKYAGDKLHKQEQKHKGMLQKMQQQQQQGQPQPQAQMQQGGNPNG